MRGRRLGEGGERERERERERVGQWQPEDRQRREGGREALEPTTRLGTENSRKMGPESHKTRDSNHEQSAQFHIGIEYEVNCTLDLLTRKGCYLDKRFCTQFFESSPYLPGQQGSCRTAVELSENSEQNPMSV